MIGLAMPVSQSKAAKCSIVRNAIATEVIDIAAIDIAAIGIAATDIVIEAIAIGPVETVATVIATVIQPLAPMTEGGTDIAPAIAGAETTVTVIATDTGIIVAMIVIGITIARDAPIPGIITVHGTGPVIMAIADITRLIAAVSGSASISARPAIAAIGGHPEITAFTARAMAPTATIRAQRTVVVSNSRAGITGTGNWSVFCNAQTRGTALILSRALNGLSPVAIDPDRSGANVG